MGIRKSGRSAVAAIAAMLSGASSVVGAAGWRTVASDQFDTRLTFAERWRPGKGEPVKSANGRAEFAGSVAMTFNFTTPDAFRASATFAVKTGRAGLRCGGKEVAVRAGETRRVTLDCSQGGCRTSRLVAFADGEATMDDFAVEVPVAADASPNLVINSGFEQAPDGYPLYAARSNGSYPFGRWRELPIEDFLALMGADERVVHSGRRSFRLVGSPYVRSGFQMKNVATKKGAAGVLSVYLKADRPGMKVEFNYGPGKRTVEPTLDWARYEVVCTNLPAVRAYFSPVNLHLARGVTNGTVWVDDMQAEFLDRAPDAAELAGGKTFATPYRPSDLDKTRFDAPPPRRSPGFAAKRLPPGVKPTVDLDAWTPYAGKSTPFWVEDRRPSHATDAWIALDDETLWVGVRCYGEKFVSRGDRPYKHDSGEIYGGFRTSTEFLVDPNADGKFWQFGFNDFGDNDIGAGRDIRWSGEWIHEIRGNDKADATDYLYGIPLRYFASSEIKDAWPLLIGRNDGPVGESSCNAISPLGGFQRIAYWPLVQMPAEVTAKYRLKADRTETAGGAPHVLSRLDYYMDEPEAKFRVTWPDGRRETVSVDIRSLPCGTNAVTVAGVATAIVKRPYRKGATQVNRFTRSLMHDGKPIFHAGPFVGDLHFTHAYTREHLEGMSDFFAAHGFKYQHVLIPQNTDRNFPQSFDNGEAYLRRTAENGQIVLLWTGFEEFKPDSTPAEAARVVATNLHFAAAFQRWNHISSIIVTDEPELGRPSDEIRDLLVRLKPYFPYHPVQMNNTTMGIPNNYADLKTDVLMLDDYLTNSEGRSVKDIVRQADLMWKAGESEGKPCYYFLVGANTPLHYKEPSYDEQIAQCWGVICSGVTGISWFMGTPVTPGNWRAMKQVAHETAALEEILLSEEEIEPARASVGRADLRTITRRRGGELLVAACNISGQPLDRTVFALPEGAPRNGKVEVLFEQRTIDLANGVFVDDFAPLTRHLYRLRMP